MIPGLCAAVYRGSSGTSGGLTAVASPAFIGTTGFSGHLTSAAFTCTPTGGTGPYTYLWVFSSGDSTVHANSTTSASTTTGVTLGRGDLTSATFYCQVTDSAAHVVKSNLVNSSFQT